MLRRLASIAAVLMLAACSDNPYAPIEVTRQRTIDDGTTVPKGSCDDFAPATKALIPWCVEDQQ